VLAEGGAALRAMEGRVALRAPRGEERAVLLAEAVRVGTQT